MAAFAFDAVDSGALIRFQPRSGAPAIRLQALDTLAVAPDQPDLDRSRAPDGDLPAALRLLFVDGLRDYRPAAVEVRRLAGAADRELAEALPLVLDDAQARSIAERRLAEAWVGWERLRLRLPPSALAVEPGDLIALDDGGPPYRIGRVIDGGSRAVEAEAAAPEIYGALQAGLDLPRTEIRPLPGPALLDFLDLPLLDAGDDPAAPHVAATASPFRTLAVMDSDDGASFTLDTLVARRATLGITLADFPEAPPELWDEGNRLALRLLSGSLESRSREALLAGPANVLALGNGAGEWEIVQFAEAVLTGPLTYELAGFLRGRLGSDHAMGRPLAAGARVVVLDAAVVPLTARASERDVPRVYRWGPADRDLTDPSWTGASFTARGVAARPLAPVHVAGRRNAVGDLTVTWVRRSRLAGGWDVPLGEESERYEVDILDGAVVCRTLASTVPTVTYEAAAAVADFGAPPSAVTMRVYQISAMVGRGIPAEAQL